MKKGILFFDVDGTLIDNKRGQIVPDKEVTDAIQKVRRNGYYCMISSGRNMAGLEAFRNICFDGFVFSDGAGIMKEGEAAQIIPFEHAALECVLEELVNEYGCDVNACWENGSFVSQGTYKIIHSLYDENIDETEIQKVLAEQNIALLDTWKNELILEVDIFFPDERTKKNWIKQKPLFVEFVDMEGNYGEITMKGVSKASGCVRMVQKLGIDINDCYAFGDSMNDKEMLTVCGKSVLMGNGDPRLKDSVDYVSGNVDDGGLIQAFQYFELI